MKTHETARPAGCGSTSIPHHAYGELVAGLLNEQSPDAWQKDLWTIFAGFMVSESNNGYNPQLGDLFSTFRDLHFLFEGFKAIQARKEGSKL